MNTFIRASCTLLIALIIGLSAFTPAYAQEKAITGVVNANLRNFGAITNAGEVSGYYFFYETGAPKRKERKFVVSLLDQNLDQIGQKSYTGSYATTLEEGVYNGNVLALKFSDFKEETFTIRLLDRNGEQIGSRKVPYGVMDDPRYKTSGGASAAGMSDQTLFAVPGRGFVNYAVDTRKGAMSPTYYTIQFIPDDNDREKAWTLKSNPEGDDYEIASFLAAGENVLVSTVVKRKKLMDRDLEYFVLGVDLTTGKKLFERPVEDDRYAIMITNARLQDGVVRYFGQYFEKDAKTAKETSLGLCSFTMALDGTISDRRYVSWAGDVGNLFFHDFIPTPSGSIYAVAENYRKSVSVGGIALKLLSKGAGSVSSVFVEDLYVLKFSPDFALEDISVIEKSKHEVSLPSGAAYMSPQLLSYVVLYYNGYDYVFTQRKDDLFSVGYMDYEKRKGEKNRLVYGAVNYLDGGLSTDKVDLDTDADALRLLPAKTGYVAVWEYFGKQSKMDIRLERVNF